MPRPLPLDDAYDVDLDPFSRIQLIVADLDGTLLDPIWSVIALIQAAIPRLRRRGVRFTIATGRAFHGIVDVLPRLGLTASTPLALYNGSLCIDAGARHILHTRVIPSNTTREVVDWGLKLGFPVLCYPQLSVDASGFREAPIGFTIDGSRSKFPEPNGYDIPWLLPGALEFMPECLAVLVDIRGLKSPPEQLPPISCGEVTMTRSGPAFLEIRPAGSNKGVAVEAIARRLHLPLSSVLAIGDNDNDIEMLEAAGVSVAVGNASAGLRSIASYSTSLPAAKGCLQVFRQIIAARRYRATAIPRAEGSAP